MASLASGREARCDVIHGRLRAVVVGLVAGHAGGARQVVVIVHMAQRAWRCGVEASERPTSGGVIELAVRPQNRVVAAFAGCWETQSDMVDRCFRTVVVRLMATDARRRRDLVIAVDVTLEASHSYMKTRERPTRGRMIELTVRP